MKTHLVAIHVAVFLFGLSGLFAKLLVLSPVAIVWWRCLFATAALGLVVGICGEFTRPKLNILGTGIVLAAHWLTFFHSIQLSTVAIGLLSFSIFPIVVAIIEPLFDDAPWHRSSLIYALIASAGVALIVLPADIDASGIRGTAWGMVSGVLYALVTIMNRRAVRHTDPLQIGLWQNAAAFCVLLPFNLNALAIDLPALGLVILLGVVITAGAHTLFIHGMRRVPARLAALIGTLEPVYGIAAAVLIIGEIPSLGTLAGGILIVLAVASSSRRASLQ